MVKKGKKQKSGKLERLWLNREEAVALTGRRSDEYFRKNIQAGLPSDCIRKLKTRGTPLEFYAPSIVARLVRLAGGNEIDPDPLLSGSDSPALERFRAARADREELELALRRKELIDVGEFLTWWDSEIVVPLRKGLEKLQRKYGPEAVGPVTAGLQQSAEAVSRRFSSDGE